MTNKYKFFMITLTIISIFLIQVTNARTLPLYGKVITIDPGHGGRDPGTMYRKIMEKDLNLEISKVLQDSLMRQGAIVHLIREDDSDLSSKWDPQKKRGDLYRRILLIQNKKSDLYLSIHLNWSNDISNKGAEVLYHSISSKNKVLGESIMNSLKESTHSRRELIKTSLYLYKNTRVPGVLIECGFLSNPNERYLLQTKAYQNQISRAITKGVIDYIEKDT